MKKHIFFIIPILLASIALAPIGIPTFAQEEEAYSAISRDQLPSDPQQAGDPGDVLTSIGPKEEVPVPDPTTDPTP